MDLLVGQVRFCGEYRRLDLEISVGGRVGLKVFSSVCVLLEGLWGHGEQAVYLGSCRFKGSEPLQGTCTLVRGYFVSS